MARKSLSTITEAEWKATVSERKYSTVLEESQDSITYSELAVAQAAAKMSQETYDEAARRRLAKRQANKLVEQGEVVLPYSI